MSELLGLVDPLANDWDPFRFDVVGNLDSEGAELAEHEGRLL